MGNHPTGDNQNVIHFTSMEETDQFFDLLVTCPDVKSNDIRLLLYADLYSLIRRDHSDIDHLHASITEGCSYGLHSPPVPVDSGLSD